MTDLRYLTTLSALLMLLTTIHMASKGHAYPTEDNILEDAEPIAYPLSVARNFQEEKSHRFNQIEKPKSCFHFYVSRNMSSLLSDATKMLQQVRDRRERDWILTFIYRIKSLAEHLRTHPESRNYHCLPSEDDSTRRNSALSDRLKIPQQELYFVDDMPPNQNQKRGSNAEGLLKDSTEENVSDGQDTQPNDTETNPQKDADNHSLQSGAWSEQSMYGITPEGVAKAATASSLPTNQSTTKSVKEEAHHVYSIPASATATLSELTQSEKDANSVKNAAIQDGDVGSRLQLNDLSEEDRRRHDNVIVLSSPPDCISSVECEKAYNRHVASSSNSNLQRDEGLVQQLHLRQHEINAEEDRMQQRVLKQRIRKALLEDMAPEVKKLRTVGGSEEDLVNLWKQSEEEAGNSPEGYREEDFDYEENGAAAGDLNSDDRYSSDQTIAPSVGEMKNFKREYDDGKGTKPYEPYDDSDVLVKQLFDVRFEHAPSKTTKSLSDEHGEYLITSTHIPY